MTRLLRVEENAMTTYYIEDSDAAKTYCCDWDLNEAEEQALIENFLSHTGPASDFQYAEEAEDVTEDWFLSHNFVVLEYKNDTTD